MMVRRRVKKGKKPEGWVGEPGRHALAAQGVETVGSKVKSPPMPFMKEARFKCFADHEEFVTKEEAAAHFKKYGRPHGVFPINR